MFFNFFHVELRELIKVPIPLIEALLIERSDVNTGMLSGTGSAGSSPTLTPGMTITETRFNESGQATGLHENATVDMSTFMDNPNLVDRVQGMIDRYAKDVKG